jgi:hypothetical protein
MKHLACLVLLSACAYRTPAVDVPDTVPPIAARELAIDTVTVTDAGQEVAPEVALDVRCEVSRLILGAVRERGAQAGRARVDVRVDLESGRSVYDSMREDGLAAITLLGAPFGLVMARQELAVEVTIHAPGSTLIGRGRASRLGSIYAPARRRALAAALDQALAVATPVRAR